MRTKVKEIIKYLSNNYDWIQSIPLIGGYGSGHIEKTVIQLEFHHGIKYAYKTKHCI